MLEGLEEVAASRTAAAPSAVQSVGLVGPAITMTGVRSVDARPIRSRSTPGSPPSMSTAEWGRADPSRALTSSPDTHLTNSIGSAAAIAQPVT